jgi:TPR repeat protein
MLAFAAAADYQAGLDAYRGGDYHRAYEQWIEVANSPADSVHPSVLAESFYALGMLYWMGRGVPQDTAASAGWLQRAAELNHTGAQAKLGYLYSSGQGVPQSDFEAFKWLQMAANQGDVDAQFNLGVMYRDGIGVEADATRAMQWFSEAASNGDAVAAAIVQHYQDGAGENNHPHPAAPSQAPEATAPGPADANPAVAGGRLRPTEAEVASEGADWIRQRDPEHYTIQVLALLSQEKMLDFIARHPDWAPFAIYQQEYQQKPLWVLVQGDYADVEVAREAVRAFPAGLQKAEKMWIRRFKMVQGLLQ